MTKTSYTRPRADLLQYDCQVEGDQRLTIQATSAEDAARQYVTGGDWSDDGEAAGEITVMVWSPGDDVPAYVRVAAQIGGAL